MRKSKIESIRKHNKTRREHAKRNRFLPNGNKLPNGKRVCGKCDGTGTLYFVVSPHGTNMERGQAIPTQCKFCLGKGWVDE